MLHSGVFHLSLKRVQIRCMNTLLFIKSIFTERSYALVPIFSRDTMQCSSTIKQNLSVSVKLHKQNSRNNPDVHLCQKL